MKTEPHCIRDKAMTAAIIPPIAHMDLLVFMVVGFACFYFIYITKIVPEKLSDSEPKLLLSFRYGVLVFYSR